MAKRSTSEPTTSPIRASSKSRRSAATAAMVSKRAAGQQREHRRGCVRWVAIQVRADDARASVEQSPGRRRCFQGRARGWRGGGPRPLRRARQRGEQFADRERRLWVRGRSGRGRRRFRSSRVSRARMRSLRGATALGAGALALLTLLAAHDSRMTARLPTSAATLARLKASDWIRPWPPLVLKLHAAVLGRRLKPFESRSKAYTATLRSQACRAFKLAPC